MLPPQGAVDTTLSAPDAFDIPVFVRRSSPLEPAPRPTAAMLSQASQAWPTPADMPPDGNYLVTTTWRDILDAAVTVGRDIAPWIAAVPQLARREILARRYPLSAYLIRRQAVVPHQDGVGREVVPSVVYTHGTENSTRSAFGYHVGMTMAEWACRGLMGLGPTTHAESAIPPGALTGWKHSKSLPDLFGTHSSTSDLWLVEAKGGRVLGSHSRRKGARQLDVGSLVPGTHQKVLCGTSLQRRLFMMIDIEADGSAAEKTDSPIQVDDEVLEHDDDALVELARARMLTYLALVSLPRGSLTVTAVSDSLNDIASRRTGGLVQLLEGDDTTSALRRDLDHEATGSDIVQREGIDMLTARLPGTDLMIGMSRRLFGACRGLAGAEAAMVAEIEETSAMRHSELRTIRPLIEDVAAVPALPGDVSERRYEKHLSERHEQVRGYRDRRRGDFRQAARRGFTAGKTSSWERFIEITPRLTSPAEDGYLEAATRDTYLAVEQESLDLDTGAF
ncbi:MULTISPECIES: hypothetical protein [Streptomyces]|uniref:hypothetical protein n=1 Tax=Streptomyces TaxID=1883 RepID=UPI001E29CC4D|nr:MULTISPECIES: hypothetical protein [Streptomyces]UFQ15732.1 hypothetical protein J2N69_12385 [Streptomyces huasconensis]WCL85335.1 hypothetical protein PPN52_12395 [Streptomyces sp. JCM 35825]